MKLVGLSFGAAFGFIMGWAHLADPVVIREMLLLKHADVFLFMGSAVAVAGLGHWLLRRLGARSLVSGERLEWSRERPARRHIVGSAIFGAGWSVAGTCPGPVAAMLGEGRIAGVFVVLGLVGGALLQAVVSKRGAATSPAPRDAPDVAGL
jgi:uncharacterized membrane protein YedE/YeeE